MKTTGNRILITGGATGIGLAMAELFLESGNKVIVCGRREEMLDEAKARYPELVTVQADVSYAEDRKMLYEKCESEFGGINILVNNAGIQREVIFTQGKGLDTIDQEVLINLAAPIQLCALFTPMLIKEQESAILNVSSGLGFIPIAIMPVYCATKAALHSFTWSLRHQLKNTSIRVFEVIPPIVDTDLDKGARDSRGMSFRGIQPEEMAKATMEGIENDRFEITTGHSQGLVNAARNNPEEQFARMNDH